MLKIYDLSLSKTYNNNVIEVTQCNKNTEVEQGRIKGKAELKSEFSEVIYKPEDEQRDFSRVTVSRHEVRGTKRNAIL
jgi:hypothetical protein